MADVTQNISAQLFVKELPPTSLGDYTGCKRDFRSPYLTTCVNNVESDVAVENAFQSQLNLSEYYKSPYVFDTMKRDYMSKTMDAAYETQEVDLNPPPLTGKTGSQPIDVIDIVKTGNGKATIKESFGSMNSNTTIFGVLIAAILIYLFLKNKD